VAIAVTSTKKTCGIVGLSLQQFGRILQSGYETAKADSLINRYVLEAAKRGFAIDREAVVSALEIAFLLGL